MRLYYSIPALAITLVLAGCGESGPETYAVKGTVTYAGKPVPTGMVNFVGIGNSVDVSAPIAEDGAFELHAAEGEYRVGVVALREVPLASDWQTQMSHKSPPPYVPSVFNDPEKSKLTASVRAQDENQVIIDIPELQRRGRRRGP